MIRGLYNIFTWWVERWRAHARVSM